jgi:hypothetical protein
LIAGTPSRPRDQGPVRRGAKLRDLVHALPDGVEVRQRIEGEAGFGALRRLQACTDASFQSSSQR